MKKTGKIILVGVLCALAGGAAVFAAMSIYLGGVNSLPVAAKFTAAYNTIDREFIGEANMDEVLDRTYRAMADSLNDRWSFYMNQEEYDKYLEDQNNSYRGIGITVTNKEESYPLIEAVTKNSPAQEVGLQPGERILQLDGESLYGFTSTEVGSMIKSKGDREFTLLILSKNGEERTVTLAAREIFTDPVEYEMLDGDIAYIKLVDFDSGCAKSAIAAIDELMEQGAKGIILDVRNNPGGFVHELTKLLDYLLPEGEIFVSVERDGSERVTSSDADCVDLPMTVLVNSNSYSAAELLAAVLREYDAASLVGEPTTGKNRAQQNMDLPDGSALHLSTSGFLTPKRVDLVEQGGLTPDYEVELDEEEQDLLRKNSLPHEDDEQLQKAVEVLFEAVA